MTETTERAADAAPRSVHLKDYLPPAWLVERVVLHFDLGEERTVVTSRLDLHANPARGLQRLPLELDGEGFELVSVALNGRPLEATRYQRSATALTLEMDADSGVLEVVTALRPQDNLALEGLYKSSGNFCTQCEAEGFRRITYYPDRPDVMACFHVTLEADRARYPVLLSNGNPVAAGESPQGRHWAVWEDPFPKPAYLFALVAGRLALVEDSFITASGRPVALHLYVEPGNEDKCGHALASLKKAMAWDERVFGLEYDLDVYMIVAVGDFNMGAMENKGLNVFNTKFVLARPDTATDFDYQSVESVIAHEYFHNWTGNRVTCRDWFQLSLKEGLTVFRDQQFSADMQSAAVKRIADVQRLRAGQFPEDAGATAHPVRPESYIEINNFYTPTVYEKGAEVVRMLHTLLGPAGFRRGMDLYFRRHDGQAVTCDDFRAAMADANGIDLGHFALWYAQAGTPEVAAHWHWDAATQSFTLTLSQSTPPTPGQPEKRPLPVPVAVGLLDPAGRDMPLRLAGESAPAGTTRVLLLDTAEQSFQFVGIPEAPVPSLLRGFSAPVRLSAAYDESDLAFLMARDSDLFNRWEAGQTLATRLLLGLTDKAVAGAALELPETFIAAVAAQLADAGRDGSFAARALSLPTEGYLGQQMPVVMVDALHTARQFARRRLGESLRPQWLATYTAHDDHGPFSVAPEAMARRALRNQCLATLMAAEDAEAQALCRAQYHRAANMTDVLAALFAVVDSSMTDREDILADFYHRWQNDPLVVNKWLSLQAGSARPDTLDRVRTLLDHPAFDIRNPNKVYALVGAFAVNQVQFHAADGSGYAFLADQVLRLDTMNAQVASRMANPFTRLRRFDGPRQALIRSQLERILAAPALSRDVYEIISKSLAA